MKLDQIPIKEQVKIRDEKENNKKTILDYKVIGKIFSKYILLSDNEEFVIVDILNSKFRLIYEKLLKDYNNRSINKQILLFPIILDLNEYKMSLFETIKDKLNNLGIEADIFDEYSIAIRTMPNDLCDNLDKEDIRAMFDELLIKDNQIFEELLYKMICKKRINSNFTDFEVNELIIQLSKLNLDINVYDKKVLRKISKEDFEKIFFKD